MSSRTNAGLVDAPAGVGASVPQPRFAIVVFLILGVIALALSAGINPGFVRVLPAALGALLAFAVTARRLAPLAVSPGFYFAAYLAGLGFLGFHLTNVFAGSGGTGGVDVVLDLGTLQMTASSFLFAAIIVLIAASFARGGRAAPVGPGPARPLDLGDLGRYSSMLLVFSLATLMLLIYFLGIGSLLERSGRLVGSESSIQTAVGMSAIAAVVASGIVVFSRRGILRIVAILSVLGFTAYFVSLGTRRLALMPILLLLSYALARRGAVRPLAVMIATIAALVLLTLPLYFRSLPSHGLIPHLNALGSFSIGADNLSASFNNILAGFKITAMTGFGRPHIGIDAFWVSINPITGDSVGWSQIAPSLRLNRFTPYSGLGELINLGSTVFVVSLGLIGLALGNIQRINDKLFTTLIGRLFAIGTLGLTFIFVIQSTQYNLRSNLRYLYFAIGLQLAALLILRLREAIAQKRRVPGHY
ncbi:hypothetical protein M2152_002057 [Microbacteriaceae bacterium SG_E_30_P1]|uniref:O-antigen polysaccharide polymerase Wzy-like protein n=1 Tax=Antiquaquibacter oligotrophicus TaxID=2880260 RepID=A0ABT6KPF7_9MICO|nr:hypothetical protein [Antiquaquibacter oligotrophicus]MDH6181875.1 hypothetical protein [Antiquaquibacter oligotrophicus]UDF12450.1 hypothetical protein LH407_09805 [Antiquaquibacter oligotrophicus]